VRLDEGRAGVAAGGEAAAARWFGQDVFDDPNILGPDGSDDEEGGSGSGSEEEAPAAAAAARAKPGRGKPAAAAAAGSDEDESDEEPPPAKQQRGRAAKPGAAGAAGAAAGGGGAAGGGSGSEDPWASDASEAGDSDLEEFESLDDQGRAEVLALAKRMLRRKDKETVMDAAYNRYAFNDEGPLPRWFLEDERRAMRPIPQVGAAGRPRGGPAAAWVEGEGLAGGAADPSMRAPRGAGCRVRARAALPRPRPASARPQRPCPPPLPPPPHIHHPQVTKAEVEAQKAAMAAIDSRPIKKVAEAKARKRKRMQVRARGRRAGGGGGWGGGQRGGGGGGMGAQRAHWLSRPGRSCTP
jgi:hypothetical protein